MDKYSILGKYAGFNIEKYREFIHDACLPLDMTYEEKEKAVLKILTHKECDFKASCKTCGRTFYLDSLEHTCNNSDVLLFKYTSKPFVNREDILTKKDDIKNRYPLKDENIGVYAYRGLNFLTKEAYESFVFNVNNGLLVEEKATSWTIKEESSERFAYYIQQGTILSDKKRKGFVDAVTSFKSKITGYKGIILKTKLNPESVLADISDNDFGKFSEHEVILLPGKYDIEIIKTINRDGSVEVGDFRRRCRASDDS